MPIERGYRAAPYEYTGAPLELLAHTAEFSAKQKAAQDEAANQLLGYAGKAVPGTGDWEDQIAFENDVKGQMKSIADKYAAQQMTGREYTNAIRGLASKIQSDPGARMRTETYNMVNELYPKIAQHLYATGQYDPALDPRKNPGLLDIKSFRSPTNSAQDLLPRPRPSATDFAKEAWTPFLNKNNSFWDEQNAVWRTGVDPNDLPGLADKVSDAYVNDPRGSDLYAIYKYNNPNGVDKKTFLQNFFYNSATPSAGGEIDSQFLKAQAASNKGAKFPYDRPIIVKPSGHLDYRSQQRTEDVLKQIGQHQGEELTHTYQALRDSAINNTVQAHPDLANINDPESGKPFSELFTKLASGDYSDPAVSKILNRAMNEAVTPTPPTPRPTPMGIMRSMSSQNPETGDPELDLTLSRGWVEVPKYYTDSKGVKRPTGGVEIKKLTKTDRDKLINDWKNKVRENPTAFPKVMEHLPQELKVAANTYNQEITTNTEQYFNQSQAYVPTVHLTELTQQGNEVQSPFEAAIEKQVADRNKLEMDKWNLEVLPTEGELADRAEPKTDKEIKQRSRELLNVIQAKDEGSGRFVEPVHFGGFSFIDRPGKRGYYITMQLGEGENARTVLGTYDGLTEDILQRTTGISPEYANLVNRTIPEWATESKPTADLLPGINDAVVKRVGNGYQVVRASDNKPVLSAPDYPSFLSGLRDGVQTLQDLQLIQQPQRNSAAPTSSVEGATMTEPLRQSLSAIPYINSATITSGFRTAEENAAVGGVSDSLHMSGNAVDIRNSDAVGRNIQNWLSTPAGKQWAKANQIDVVFESDHIHLERDTE